MPLTKTHDSVIGDVFKIFIAIIFPPLAVLFEVGLGKHFWINLVLLIFGFLPASIHAVYIVATR